VLQTTAGLDVAENHAQAEEILNQAAAGGAQLAVLPEYWTYLGPLAGLPEHAEPVPGPSSELLAAVARRTHMAILGGSFPERSDEASGRVFNTSLVFDGQGRLVARYRKQHLFDVDVGPVSFQESAKVAPGDPPTLVELNGWPIGLSICYDLRFPELYRSLAGRGARVLAVPAAFTEYTGKDHWHLLLRARAVEDQCWVVAANSASHREGVPTCYGHSLVADPWGVVVVEAPGDRPALLSATLDASYQDELRDKLPSLRHRRLSPGGEVASPVS
jgi:predicted amidohydrolase